MVEQPPKKKKKKKHNPVRDYAIYICVRILGVVVHMFSADTNLRTARFFGRLLWNRYHRGRKRAMDNLRASYPEKSDRWIRQTGKESFQQLVMFAMDLVLVPRLVRKHNWRDYSRYKTVERAKWLMQEGRGLLMVTAHYGNFEIMGYLLGLFDFNTYSIARPLDNKYLSRYLYGLRERVGQRIIDKKGAAQLMPKITATGATLCFIADQDAGRKGVFVDFMGRKASTYKSIGLLAITNSIPVCIGYSRRIGNRFFFEIGVNRIIMPEEWADKEDPLEWVTQEYSKAIEQFVRQDPSQYWWLHRRWKTQPKQRKAKS